MTIALYELGSGAERVKPRKQARPAPVRWAVTPGTPEAYLQAPPHVIAKHVRRAAALIARPPSEPLQVHRDSKEAAAVVRREVLRAIRLMARSNIEYQRYRASYLGDPTAQADWPPGKVVRAARA